MPQVVSLYSALALSVVMETVAGQAVADEWGLVTNKAQLAISVTSRWSHTFIVGDTNTVQTPYRLKSEVKAGEPATAEWGPVTNSAQMAISVVPTGSLAASKGRSILEAGTGGLVIVTNPITVKSELKAGELFSLWVRIRNLSTNETFSFSYQSNPYPDAYRGLACVVISPSGKDVSPSTPTNSPTAPLVWRGPPPPVGAAGPNQTGEFEFWLWELCKLDEIGTYKIAARKTIWGKEGKVFDLISSTLCVSVVPGK
jgi:hypothetical protein